MDRFRKTDPDAPRLAAAVLWDEVGPAYTMETFIRGAAAILDHIEPDAIEQPRLPTRSEVQERLEQLSVGPWTSQVVATEWVERGWATEDPEPEVDPAQVSALGSLLLTTQDDDDVYGQARRLLASGMQVTPQ